jgi:hypothetical protein
MLSQAQQVRWSSLNRTEKQAFLLGFEDCDVNVLKHKASPVLTNLSNDRLATQVDQILRREPSLPLSTAIKRAFATVDGRARPIGDGQGERESPEHGELNGLWWRGSTSGERGGLVAGVRECLQSSPSHRNQLSSPNKDYIDKLTEEIEKDPAADDKWILDMLLKASSKRKPKAAVSPK